MVSYFPSMYSKNPASNLPYAGSWYPGNYHHPPNHQFLSDNEMTTHQAMYYNQHLFHQASPDWTSHESLLQASVGSNLHLNHTASAHHSASSTGAGATTTSTSVSAAAAAAAAAVAASAAEHNNMQNGLSAIPSPPTTVSGSEMSSPGAPNGSISPHISTRPVPVKSPYEWMKKPSYQNQTHTGKTRTKDKYRVVYTDYQRLELEKEFHTSRYITIRRKSELAQSLQLSERQVKIWFQNRRAKERKCAKKNEGGVVTVVGGGLMQNMDMKPKMEHVYMGSIGMGMSPLGLHPGALHHSHSFGVPTASHSVVSASSISNMQSQQQPSALNS